MSNVSSLLIRISEIDARIAALQRERRIAVQAHKLIHSSASAAALDGVFTMKNHRKWITYAFAVQYLATAEKINFYTTI